MDGLIDRKVYIVLKNDRKYTGVVKEIQDAKLLVLIDKFDKTIYISIDDISFVEEQEWDMYVHSQKKKEKKQDNGKLKSVGMTVMKR